MQGGESVLRLRDGDHARYGKFELPEHIVEKCYDALVEDIFSKCFILRCEFCYSRLAFVYEAWSREFDPLEAGSEIPWYTVEQSNISFKLVKI